MKLHHPPHLFLNNTYYFLTARVYHRQWVFNTDERKAFLLHSLKAVFRNHGYKLLAWVVLDNHYHLQFRTDIGSDLGRVMNLVHGRVAYQINKCDGMSGRKIFQNYWDRCIRDERDYYRHLNYIHHNPLKHGIARAMADYTFSSYQWYVETYGQEWVDDCFRQYSIVDFSP